ncbi:FecR domain-containing protein [Cupriavidus sp. 2TAF22]|uniref:FecR domain-containing protein n=1 Tax=unclassified Cupriavidus TaxID=2640874 RepID=UPI003F925F4C
MVDKAVTWTIRLDFGEPTAGTREAFAQWLKADPLHALAWQRVQALRDDFSGVPAALALDTLQTAGARRSAGGLKRRQALKVLALAGISLLAVQGVRELAPWQRLLADTSTATGEQRTVRLDDGSTIVLNTDTAISTGLGAERRLITLRRGEILVTTGHDDEFSAASGAARPFWVQTPFGSLRALGTRFVVRIEGARARVSVQEGAVALYPSAGNGEDVARAGTTWWLAADGSTPAAAPPIAPDGWAEGVIAGKDMRLADVLAELARYRTGRIVCDPRVADLRISGTYHLRDTDRTLRFLAQSQPVSIAYRTRLWVTVGPAGGN